MNTQPSALELVVEAAGLAQDKKSYDVTVLKTGQVTSLADYFLVCSCDSRAQVRAISESIRRQMKDNHQMLPMGEERDIGDLWHLLDYGDVVIHVMHVTTREHYQLETFWSHAEPVPRQQWEQLLAS